MRFYVWEFLHKLNFSFFFFFRVFLLLFPKKQSQTLTMMDLSMQFSLNPLGYFDKLCIQYLSFTFVYCYFTINIYPRLKLFDQWYRISLQHELILNFCHFRKISGFFAFQLFDNNDKKGACSHECIICAHNSWINKLI